jgi:Rieske 2Fe-2S family protein
MDTVTQPPPPAPDRPLDALIRSRRPGHMLPAEFYLRPDIFAADLDALFRRQWLFVGTAADVPEPGAAFTVDIGDASVIVVRGDDEVVRAFHNVCRHRGARLLAPGPASLGKLVCPYHQWTYELTGELVHARHMGRDFDRACHGLRPVHLRAIGGLLFVCLAERAPAGIDRLAAAMEPRLAPYDLADTRVAFEMSIIEEGNWKLTMENNRECYHCAVCHPELTHSFIAADFGFDPDELDPDEAAEAAAHAERRRAQLAAWEALGFPSRPVEDLDDGDINFRTERLLIAGAGESATLDAKIACRRLLGRIGRPQMGDVHLWTHTSWHHVMSDHAVCTFILPLSPDRTRVISKWLVHKDAVEGVDYDLETLTAVWQATHRQDSELVARAQRGVRDPAYVPGPYSPFTEQYLDRFATWYLGRLHAHGY